MHYSKGKICVDTSLPPLFDIDINYKCGNVHVSAHEIRRKKTNVKKYILKNINPYSKFSWVLSFVHDANKNKIKYKMCKKPIHAYNTKYNPDSKSQLLFSLHLTFCLYF